MDKAYTQPLKLRVYTNGVLLFLFVMLLQKAQGQEKLDVAAGLGFPEAIHAGLRFQLKPFQLGASVGTIPRRNESVFTVSGDLFFHFAGTSRFSGRRPVYLRTGITYLRDELKSRSVDKLTYLNMRVGRDLNFSKRFGLNIDGGVGIELNKERVDLNPNNDNWFSDFDIDIPVFPTASIGIFYRL